MKVGDHVKDADGSCWIIVGVMNDNGRKKYSRVREGSLAAEIHLARTEETKRHA